MGPEKSPDSSTSRATGFLAGLKPRTREALLGISRLAHYDPGQAIVKEGDKGTNAYILLSGRCEVTIGKETAGRIFPGELFGEIASLEGGTRTATVTASDACEVLRMPGHALRQEVLRSPAFLDSVLRAILRRTRVISRRDAEAREEHRALREVQEEMMASPEVLRRSEHLSVEVRWVPLTYASGDYYEILDLGSDRYLFAIGDVMGHGARTSPTTAMVRGQLRELAKQGKPPEQILAHLDRHLQEHGPADVFMTLTVLILDGATMTTEYSIAGHLAPLLYRGGDAEPLAAQTGLMLGLGLGHRSGYGRRKASFRSGDKLLLFTDGLTEATRGPNPERDMLGVEPLKTIFAELCHRYQDGIVDRLFKAVDHFRSGYEVQDDATALLIYVR